MNNPPPTATPAPPGYTPPQAGPVVPENPNPSPDSGLNEDTLPDDIKELTLSQATATARMSLLAAAAPILAEQLNSSLFRQLYLQAYAQCSSTEHSDHLCWCCVITILGQKNERDGVNWEVSNGGVLKESCSKVQQNAADLYDSMYEPPYHAYVNW